VLPQGPYRDAGAYGTHCSLTLRTWSWRTVIQNIGLRSWVRAASLVRVTGMLCPCLGQRVNSMRMSSVSRRTMIRLVRASQCSLISR
jgi:hypothetical protein